jgi:hypothetical protein
VAIAIVRGALLRIAQGFVSLAQFLEVFFRGFVARVLVRMMFDGQFAIGLLDLFLVRVALTPRTS